MPLINPWTISLAITALATGYKYFSDDEPNHSSQEDNVREDNSHAEQLQDFNKLLMSLSNEYGIELRDDIDKFDMQEFMESEVKGILLLLPLIKSSRLETTKTIELNQEIKSINIMLSEFNAMAKKYS